LRSDVFFFVSGRRRHTSFSRDWSSDVCSSDLPSHSTVSRKRVKAPRFSVGCEACVMQFQLLYFESFYCNKRRIVHIKKANREDWPLIQDKQLLCRVILLFNRG